ncbi:hypothetical protein HY486_00430 [Candidatus Woesearchaeota archaeon]|nr:hypothetical protein [Candidatus Woesearchaeota archaeon]
MNLENHGAGNNHKPQLELVETLTLYLTRGNADVTQIRAMLHAKDRQLSLEVIALAIDVFNNEEDCSSLKRIQRELTERYAKTNDATSRQAITQLLAKAKEYYTTLMGISWDYEGAKELSERVQRNAGCMLNTKEVFDEESPEDSCD